MILGGLLPMEIPAEGVERLCVPFIQPEQDDLRQEAKEKLGGKDQPGLQELGHFLFLDETSGPVQLECQKREVASLSLFFDHLQSRFFKQQLESVMSEIEVIPGLIVNGG